MNKYDLHEGQSISVKVDGLLEHFNIRKIEGEIVTVKALPVRTFSIKDCIPCMKGDKCRDFHIRKTAENEADYILED